MSALARAVRIVRSREGAVALIGLAVLALPLASPSQFVYQLTFVLMTNVTLAVSWVIIGGFAGYYSFGHPAFFGLGAYTAGLLVARLGVNHLTSLVASVLVAALFAVMIGSIALRVRGPYFSLLTLFVVFGLETLVIALPDLTGGTPGFSVPFITDSHTGEVLIFHYLVVFTAIAAVLTAIAVSRSRLMLALNAIREDEDVAEAMGVRTSRAKVVAFAISSALVGLIGGVSALHAAFVGPETAFSILIAIFAVLAPVMGGARSWLGPIVGAGLFVAIELGTRFAISSGLNRLVFGLLLIATVMFLRDGLVGTLETWWRRNGRSRTPVVPGGAGPATDTDPGEPRTPSTIPTPPRRDPGVED